jgi:hypothetical protein
LPTPDWDRIPHQHQKYTVNTVVTYPAGLNSPVPDASASASPGSALGAPKAAPPRPAAPKPKAKPKTKPKPKPKATN